MIARRPPRSGGLPVRRAWPLRGAGGLLCWPLLGVLALLALGALLPRPAAAASVASQGSPSLVFSEVYVPVGSDPLGQWFEIHNTQAITYPLNGLVIATGTKQVTLQTDSQIGPLGYVLFLLSSDAVDKGFVQPVPRAKIIAVPELAPLNPQADALILKTPDGSLTIDAVDWGKPDPAWPNYDKSLLWDPGLAPLDPNQCSSIQCTWGRTPPEQDINAESDWTLHQNASPGGTIGPPPQPEFLNQWTNVAGGLSSLLLWAAFIIIAIIAYRFERLRDTRTYWQLLLLAPSGLLIYTIIVIIDFSQPGAALTNEHKWWAFSALAVSAVLSLIAVGIFRRVARTLLEGG